MRCLVFSPRGLAMALSAGLLAAMLVLSPSSRLSARADPPEGARKAFPEAFPEAFLGAPPRARSGPPPGVALWRVADDDTTVWLFGTVHLLDPQLRWRRPAVDAALAAADVVYLEADTGPDAQARATPLIASLAFLPPGERLDADLAPATRDALARVAGRLGQPLFVLNRQRPWFASITLGVAWIQAQGGDAQAGADRVIESEARAAGKTIRHFETVEDQIRILASLPAEVDRRVLAATLEQIDTDADAVADMFDAWATGDMAGLAAVLDASFADEPLVRQTYLTDRNAAWVEEIARVLEEEARVVFVAVGAGHLIGPGSVSALLEARGHPISRH